MKRHLKFFISIVTAVLVINFVLPPGSADAAAEEKAKSSVKVAVLNAGSSADQNSYNSTLKKLKSYGINANGISPKEIASGKLDKFNVLIVTGEGDGAQSEALGKDGCSAIEKFVKGGGGYIGISSGAFLATEGYIGSNSGLALVNAKAADTEHWNRGSGDVQVKITNSSHPIMQGYSGVITVHYENGPVLQQAQDANIPTYSQLASYVSDVHQNEDAKTGIMPGSSAITASDYGDGRCVLFSFHPELTEGLDRMLVQGVLWTAKTDTSEFPLKLKDTQDAKVKGTWLWGSTVYDLGPDGAKIITDQLKEYGFTDIFLLVKGTSGSVTYNSNIALQVAHPDRDVLKEVIDEAHKKGIRVHAWFCIDCDNAWAAAHPEDLMVNVKKGPDPSGNRISPLSPGYRQYTESLIKEVVQNYDVDGIQLDYIRYPHAAYGFNANYEVAEAKQLGINVDRVKDLLIKTYYQYTDAKGNLYGDNVSIFEAYDRGDKDVVGWYNLRRNAVDSFAEEIKNVVKSVNPEIKYSACLMPEGAYNSDFLTAQGDSKTFAEVHYGQDYNDAAGIYDFVAPMLYWNDYTKSSQWADVLYKNTVDIFGKDRVLAGMQAYSPTKSKDLSDAVNYIRQSGEGGLAFFRFGTFGLSSIGMKDIGHKESTMEVTMTDPLNTDNTANVNITKVEIEMKGGLTVKKVLGGIDGCKVSLSSDNRTIIITGAPCIAQNGTIKISAVVDGENNTGREPAQVRFYVTNSYSEVRVYNQY